MERMTKEELEKLKDFKLYVFEGDVYVKAEDYKEMAIENKKLKSDLAYERTMLDNVKAEYKSQVEINKKLKEELENTKKEFEQYKQNYNIEKDKQSIFLMTGRRY